MEARLIIMYSKKEIYNTNPEFIELWAEVLDEMHSRFGEIAYRNWFARIEFLSLETNGAFTLAAPSRFTRDWFLNNYGQVVLEALQQRSNDVHSIAVELNEAAAPHPVNTAALHKDLAFNEPKIVVPDDPECEIFNFSLNDAYTFEQFIVDDSNSMAYNAIQSIATNKSFAKTLYVQGKVGMGKTHLLQSLTRALRTNVMSLRVAYLSAEKFMYLFLKSLKSNQIVAFKEKFKSCDVLIIDDLQFICGKNATALEFSNILTAMLESNKTVVIASDTNPFTLNIDQRTKSRIVGGLVVEIKDSSLELRKRILESKCSAQGFTLDDSIMNTLAENVSTNIRELEGALNKLYAYKVIQNTEINGALLDKILKENFDAVSNKYSEKKILSSICSYFAIDVDDIQSKSRVKKFAYPRQIAAYLLKELTHKSLNEIGKMLGGRDHASVLYFIKQVQEKIKSDSKTKIEIDQITANCS